MTSYCSSDVIVVLVLMTRAVGDHEKALGHFTAAILSNPKSALLYAKRARCVGVSFPDHQVVVSFQDQHVMFLFLGQHVAFSFQGLQAHSQAQGQQQVVASFQG